jgi:glutamate/tyrosine decarboxylase-like PLP-dependent enzyme
MPELQNSRRARGIVAWAALQQLGTGGVAAMIDGCCDHAVRLAFLLEQGGAKLVHDVVFNQALVHFGGDDRTSAVAAGAQLDGRCWVAVTRYKGRTVMRLSVASWMTTAEDIEVAAEAILECAANLR